ncbi:MAG: hypothetical protein K1X31_05375 [Gemmatimonadaceae bacterium]|nr:hypothetical protein [Gemmatimonadaceae bacterium]
MPSFRPAPQTRCARPVAGPVRPALAVLLWAVLGCHPSGGGREPGPGVARALADARARTVSGVAYDVTLDLPATRAAPVTGRVAISFDWAAAGEDLVLDFRAPADLVGAVTVDGDTVVPRLVPDHIIVPARALAAGHRTVTIGFTSTDAALNRQDDFLYALFVPDRASTALPVFEQPDLKARVSLALTIPAAWDAVANGALVSRDSSAGDGRHRLRFAETAPISTYLITFAAGRLQRLTAERGGRTFTMFHRETDARRVARNADAIFDLHAQAIAWLERYTGIPYPFAKYDLVAVPAFQFGGMEHPGAVFYRADALFLEEAPSRPQELGRASLIAHETAHMWFGDLVTMRWFDDVWMKEVFANFMAARITRPAFPDVDHALRFFRDHHATAYGVDRTAGANPIRQDLANLRDAGSLYGAIIYQKAPVVMQQLETAVGDSVFRDGLRAYLGAHRFGNASWPDLVAALDSIAPLDVAAWSRTWVEQPGRPTVTVRWDGGRVLLQQTDEWDALQAASAGSPGRAGAPATRALRWPQERIDVLLAWGATTRVVHARLLADSASVAVEDAPPGAPDLILAGVDGQSYGRFPLDDASRATLLARAAALTPALHRAVAWQTLHEEMLDGRLPARALLEAALAALPGEPDELVATQLAGLVRGTYWRWLPDATRRAVAPHVERGLWRALDGAPTPGRKGALFGTIVSVTITPDGIARLERIWRRQEVPRGFPVTEAMMQAIAEGLAIRGVPDAEAILDEQARRLTNPDRQARLAFLRPALSADPARRDSLFRSFAHLEGRRRESWVLDAVGALQHPLRAEAAIGRLEPSLALAEEIQRTGDIFFPLNWLNAALGGYASPAADSIVRRFVQAHPDMDPRVRGKLLQASDELRRASAARR